MKNLHKQMYIIKKNVSYDKCVTCGIFSDGERAFNEYFRQCSENYSWLVETISVYEKVNNKEELISFVRFREPKMSRKAVNQTVAALLAVSNY